MTGRMRKKLEDFEAYAEEIKIPVPENLPFQQVKSENKGFFFSMFIRMLYSCLVDADYLDTESFMNRKERVREYGETIASLVFALKHAEKHHMDRVIYVIPYTSIVKQNAKVFAEIHGKENVLENHCNIDYESDEELRWKGFAKTKIFSPNLTPANVLGLGWAATPAGLKAMDELGKLEEERRRGILATAVSMGVAVVFCKMMDCKKRRV